MKTIRLFGLIFSFLLLIQYTASAHGKLTASQGVEKIIHEHQATSKSFVELIKNYRGAQFTGPEEWVRFLKKLIRQDQVTARPDYPELCFQIGKWFHEEQRYRDAYYFLYITLQEEEDVNTSKKPYIAHFHEVLGQTYYYFRRYDLATRHLQISLNHPSIDKASEITIYNTLGLIYRDKLEVEKAEWYTQKAYDRAVKLNHTPWIGILSGNLGYLFLLKKEYGKARELIQFDFEMSRNTRETGSQINALRILIQLDIVDNKLEDAYAKIKQFEQLLVGNESAEFLVSFYDSKTRYFDRIGNHKDALESYKKFIEQKEIVNRKKHFLNMENAEFQINFEKKQAEIQIFQQKKKTDNLIIYGLTFFCLLLGFSSFIIIRQLQSQRRKDKEILELKAQRIKEELNSTEREMRVILGTMADKNKLIFELKQEIESVQSLNSEKNDSEKEKMLNNLQSFSLLTENDWVEFKRLFERLNGGFFNYFQDNYPEVTTAEIRLAALIKLNMSNYEMARTLGISPDSVRKTNLRLRKKLSIDHQDDLTRFIKSIT